MSIVVSGWFSQDLNLQIRFDQIYGLTAGDRIIFEQNDIGKVTGVLYEKKGTYRVDATIHHSFKNAVTDRSQFFIIQDPSGKGRKAIEMMTVKGEGVPLEDGALIEGSTRLSVLLNKMEDDVSRSVGDLKQTLKSFSEALRKAPENEDIKTLQAYLKQLLSEMKRSGAAFREMVQNDLLPRLQEEIDKLRQRLKESGREKEVEPLQTQMNELRKI